ncbi:MAG: HRDC domain-containing protein [Caldilineaceae bacterium]
MDKQKPSHLGAPTLVYNAATFAEMMAHLRPQSIIAIDTESDSLYSYYPKVCLIQISTAANSDADAAPEADLNVVDYLLDPLRFDEFGALNDLLADPAKEIILHAAGNDILTMQRDFGFSFNHIFDTQLAARILGWQHSGLARLLEAHFGIVSDKKMQLTNWGQRPLTAQQIKYAQMDTHFLPALRQIQMQELKARGRLEEAQEAFELLSHIDFQERAPTERSFWQMRVTRKMDRKDTGVLEALWLWREHEAQRQNRPPFKIMTDAVLAQIAERRPTTAKKLRGIQGISGAQTSRYAKAILGAIEEGAKRPLPDLPEQKPRPEALLDPDVLARYDALRQWRTQRATERGVDPDIVFNNDTLLSIALRQPTTECALQEISEIGPWRARTYGPEIFKIVGQVS